MICPLVSRDMSARERAYVQTDGGIFPLGSRHYKLVREGKMQSCTALHPSFPAIVFRPSQTASQPRAPAPSMAASESFSWDTSRRVFPLYMFMTLASMASRMGSMI